MKQEERRITLELAGSKITSDKFLRAISAFFGVVNDVTNQVSKKQNALAWVVSVEAGSARIVATAEPIDPDDIDTIPPVLRAIREGAASIETSSEVPRYFSEAGLQRMRELASIRSREIDTVKLIVDGAPVRLSHHTTAHVDDILGVKSKALGAIEGKLQMMTQRGGLKFAIYDDLTDRRVECSVTPEMFEEIKAAFGKRVSVYGIVSYRGNGVPDNIKVQEFRVLSKENLPTFEDVKGILKDA